MVWKDAGTQVIYSSGVGFGTLMALSSYNKYWNNSGQHWLVLVDSYGTGGLALVFVLFFEIFGLSWGFGAARIVKALEDMLGKKIGLFWYFCWRYTTPLFCL
uniref:Uncharacterized protein n=1 Tax=Romanomermis culicivorax TaxID=13658 RepID=A0A915K308_ROMCU